MIDSTASRFWNIKCNFIISFCMHGVRLFKLGQVFAVFHSVFASHGENVKKDLSRETLSSAFTSGHFMPWLQLSRPQYVPPHGALPAVCSRKDLPFGSTTQSAVRSPVQV